jgi:hypothetical protein
MTLTSYKARNPSSELGRTRRGFEITRATFWRLYLLGYFACAIGAVVFLRAVL